MRRNFSLFSAAVLFTAAGAFAAGTKINEWGPIMFGAQVSLRLAPDNRQPRVGRATPLSVRVKNLSDRTITLLVTTPRRDFTPLLTDSHKREVRPKPRLETEEELYRGVFKLKPAEVYEETFDLRELYDLREAGSYTFLLTRTILDADAKPHKVISNELRIELSN